MPASLNLHPSLVHEPYTFTIYPTPPIKSLKFQKTLSTLKSLHHFSPPLFQNTLESSRPYRALPNLVFSIARCSLLDSSPCSPCLWFAVLPVWFWHLLFICKSTVSCLFWKLKIKNKMYRTSLNMLLTITAIKCGTTLLKPFHLFHFFWPREGAKERHSKWPTLTVIMNFNNLICLR